ncbi:hypothetical protein WH297_22775 [Ochrobactrum vermis]|uniref:Uncharacterized protein n=1 Tax=Ochrobactrum vermis TaxID=1827297 RepID=A0ABU8PLS9_9HYPH|nr:hypothetical protein [Ochrobactrum vermis]
MILSVASCTALAEAPAYPASLTAVIESSLQAAKVQPHHPFQ